MNLRKILTWLVVALIVIYVLRYPESSAGLLRSAGSGLAAAGSSLASFVGTLL